MMESVKKAALDGLPIYAECGGLIYLSASVEYDDKIYPMTNLFPISLKMSAKPVGHGYTLVEVDEANPFYPVGTRIRGHEFHYSGPAGEDIEFDSCMNVVTGTGVGKCRDGLVCGNTLACYTHIHSDGVRNWASSVVAKAAEYRVSRKGRREN